MAEGSEPVTSPSRGLGGLVGRARAGGPDGAAALAGQEGCPSEEVSLPEMSSECICSENGEVRQEDFERFAKQSALRRILSRAR
jgi:hypothetical protein